MEEMSREKETQQAMAEEIGYVFVYGTLKIGGFFAKKFNQFRVSSEIATVKGEMFNLGNFPGVVLNENGRPIFGELHGYENIQEVLDMMDQIEGYSEDAKYNNYLRKEVEVNGIMAFVYEINGRPVGAAMKPGVWIIDKPKNQEIKNPNPKTDPYCEYEAENQINCEDEECIKCRETSSNFCDAGC